MEAKQYTVQDVIQARINLEPIKCLFCGSFEVTFYQYVNDAHCANCGQWQTENFDD